MPKIVFGRRRVKTIHNRTKRTDSNLSRFSNQLATITEVYQDHAIALHKDTLITLPKYLSDDVYFKEGNVIEILSVVMRDGNVTAFSVRRV